MEDEGLDEGPDEGLDDGADQGPDDYNVEQGINDEEEIAMEQSTPRDRYLSDAVPPDAAEASVSVRMSQSHPMERSAARAAVRPAARPAMHDFDYANADPVARRAFAIQRANERAQVAEDQWERLHGAINQVDVLGIKTRLSTVITSLYSRQLRLHGRKAALVTGLHEECATLLLDSELRRSLCVLPTTALFDPVSCEVRKLFPFSDLSKLRVILISNLDALPNREVESLLGRLSPWMTNAPPNKRNKLIFTCWTSSNLNWIKVHAAQKFGCDVGDFNYDAYAAAGADGAQVFRTFTDIVPLPDGELVSFDPKAKSIDLNTTAKARFVRAHEVVDKIVATPNLRHPPDDCTKVALVLLFAQFSDALRKPRLASLPVKENTMLLEWFRETHKDDPRVDLCDSQLPVLYFHTPTSFDKSLNDNQAAIDELLRLDSVERSYPEHVHFSDRMNHSRAKTLEVWPYLSSLFPKLLTLVIGMPVMLLCALGPNFPAGLCGTVASFEGGCLPEVCFVLENGERETLVVQPVTVRFICGTSYEGSLWFEVKQLPLVPAFFLEEYLLRACPIRSAVGVWGSEDQVFMSRLTGLVHGKPRLFNAEE